VSGAGRSCDITADLPRSGALSGESKTRTLWITERAEGRAAELQLQLRTQHQHLGLPSLDYLIAAIAEDHGAGLLHYDQNFDRLAAHTDLSIAHRAARPVGLDPVRSAAAGRERRLSGSIVRRAGRRSRSPRLGGARPP
jgi:hypothetical protein